MTSETPRIARNTEFFILLLTTDYEQQKALLLTATDSQINGISEIFYNLFDNSDISVSKLDKSLLEKRKHVLKQFFGGKKTIALRRRLLNRHTRLCLDSVLIAKPYLMNEVFGR